MLSHPTNQPYLEGVDNIKPINATEEVLVCILFLQNAHAPDDTTDPRSDSYWLSCESSNATIGLHGSWWLKRDYLSEDGLLNKGNRAPNTAPLESSIHQLISRRRFETRAGGTTSGTSLQASSGRPRESPSTGFDADRTRSNHGRH